MLTPSFLSNETPETSSKQTTSYWATSPRRPVRVVHEHVGDRRLAARDEVRVRRDLLEQVRLAGAARARARPRCSCARRTGPCERAGRPAAASVNRVGSKPTLRSSRSRHCSRREPWSRPATNVSSASRVDIWIGRTDSTRNGWPPDSRAERGDVLERDLGVEAAGEHPLVLVDELVGDVDVVELEARQLGLVGVGLRVEPRPEQVDDLDPALLAGARLEELLLAGADGALLHRALDDLEALGDLVGIGRRAVAAEQELADVRRHRVLAAELLGQVLADEVALEDLGGELVELVELAHRFLPTIDVALREDLAVVRQRARDAPLALVLLVGHDERDLAGARVVSFASSAMLVVGSAGSARRSTHDPAADARRTRSGTAARAT